MFIKNYSDTDFVIKYRGGEKTLAHNDVTYIDDKWITFAMIHAMFGHWVGLVEGDTPIEEFLFDNQLLAVPEQIYNVIKVGPGAPRIFVKGGKATLYFADITPQSLDDMYPAQEYTDIEGLIVPTVLTNYIAIKADKNAKVVFTNIKVA